MTPNGKIARIAGEQGGLINLDQLMGEVGLLPSGVRHRVNEGVLTHVYERVYLFGSDAPTPYQLRRGATMAAEPDAYLYGLTAVNHFGFGRFAAVGEVEIVSPSQHRIDGIDAHRSRIFPREHLTMHLDTPTTTPARAVVDLGLDMSMYQIANVIHDGVFRGWLTVSDLQAAIEHLWGRHGTAVVHDALEEYLAGGAGTRSWLEDEMVELLRPVRKPQLFVNRYVSTGAGAVEVDISMPSINLCVETDGSASHQRPPTKARDKVKSDRIRAAGGEVLRFTYHDVVHRPRQVRDTVAAAIMRRTGDIPVLRLV
jgi:very-short-patch-repair endonuclease